MMGYGGMMGGWQNPFWGGLCFFLGVITWIALIVFLVSGTIFFLKKSKDSDKK